LNNVEWLERLALHKVESHLDDSLKTIDWWRENDFPWLAKHGLAFDGDCEHENELADEFNRETGMDFAEYAASVTWLELHKSQERLYLPARGHIASVELAKLELEKTQRFAERKAQVAREVERERVRLEEQQAKEAAALEVERVQLEEQRAKEALEAEDRARALIENKRRRLQIMEALNRDFISGIALARESLDSVFTRSDLDSAIVALVQEWASEITGKSLSVDQALAIAAVEKNTKVVARAGSGKTTVLTLRALFLLEKCGIKPHEILIMTFNKKAQEELKSRLSGYLLSSKGLVKPDEVPSLSESDLAVLVKNHNLELPWISTFDAAALALHSAGMGNSRDYSLVEDQKDRIIDEIVFKLLEDEGFYAAIRSLMISFFLDDWHQLSLFEEQSKGTSPVHLPRESLSGDQVKSFGELQIANWLFMHSVPYQYERTMWIEGKERLNPDFTIDIDGRKLVIEYQGMAGDPTYDLNSVIKEEIYTRGNVEVVYIYPRDIATGSFAENLDSLLRQRFPGLDMKLLSEDELWSKIRERSESRFRKNVKSFIDNIRRTPEPDGGWRTHIERSLSSDAIARDFSLLAMTVLEKYVERLTSNGENDFVGILMSGIEALKNGQNTALTQGRVRELSSLRHICLDEYQDFSDAYSNLVKGIRSHSNAAKIFAVGDNWQSINSFMGAKVQLFEDFSNHWDDAAVLYMQNNYRSASRIVDAGNKVMAASGEPGGNAVGESVGRVYTFDSDKTNPRPWEFDDFGSDEKLTGLVRIIQTHLRQNPTDSITILWRTNSVPWWFFGKSSFKKHHDLYLDAIKAGLKPEHRAKVTMSTVNKYKGLENDAIVIADALDVSFPLVHKDSRFMALFGVEIEELLEEERRLFYVAVTRAKSALYIMTRRGHESRFMQSIPAMEASWDTFFADPVSGARLFLTGRTSQQLNEELKRAKFRFDPIGKGWTIKLPNDVSPESVKRDISQSSKPWVKLAVEENLRVDLEVAGVLHPIVI
jgi:DNA helicase IV